MEDRKRIVQYEVISGGILRFNVAGAGSFDFDMTKPTDEAEASATIQGWVKKISDKAAISHDKTTGRAATPQQKFAAMKLLAEHLEGGGAWTMREGKASLNRAALYVAVATARGRPAEVVEARFRDKPDDVLRTLLQHKDIAAEYARLTARDSGAAEELLGELEGE